jgi:hypothetical protein
MEVAQNRHLGQWNRLERLEINSSHTVGQEQSFQQMLLCKLYLYMQKNEIGPLPHTIYKISSKCIKELNIGSQPEKCLKKHMEEIVS